MRGRLEGTGAGLGAWRAVGVAISVALFAPVLLGGVPPGSTFLALAVGTAAGAAWFGYRGRNVALVLAVAAAPFVGTGVAELAAGDLARALPGVVGFTVGGSVGGVAGYAAGVACRWTREGRVTLRDVGHLGVVGLGALGVAAVAGYLYLAAR